MFMSAFDVDTVVFSMDAMAVAQLAPMLAPDLAVVAHRVTATIDPGFDSAGT